MPYTFSNNGAKGLRKVVPYYYTHSVSAKGRWLDKTPVQILSTELSSMYPPHHLRKTIDSENVKLIRRDKLTDAPKEYTDWDSLNSVVFKNGSILESRVHRHEPAVPVTLVEGLPEPIKVIHEDDQLLVVDKPRGVPVHASGKYRLNSVKEILLHERPDLLTGLFPAHRLDKNTTGVLVFAKSGESVNKVSQQIMARTAKKEYLARVEGKFPSSIDVDVDVLENTTKRDATPKTAHTWFGLVSFNGTHSIVRCLPTTGRNHQIRQHLLHIGFPIENDREYNPVLSEEKRSLRASDSLCSECGLPLYDDPDDSLYLHAYKYTLEEGVFSTDLPEWAKE